MKPDKIIITVSGDGYNIQGLAGKAVIAEQTQEFDGTTSSERSGDDLFTSMPVELAATLDAMDLMLLDAVIALMPNRRETA